VKLVSNTHFNTPFSKKLFWLHLFLKGVYMNKLLKTVLFFVLFDAIYLFLSNKYFQRQIKLVQGSGIQIQVWKLVLTYIILVLGFYYFVIVKNLSLKDTFLLGLFIYAVYEFTNYSIFKQWNWFTVVLDSLWGGILYALVRYFVKN
jgi:uncharacterized membrane protein